jgi:hypothetical protein
LKTSLSSLLLLLLLLFLVVVLLLLPLLFMLALLLLLLAVVMAMLLLLLVTVVAVVAASFPPPPTLQLRSGSLDFTLFLLLWLGGAARVVLEPSKWPIKAAAELAFAFGLNADAGRFSFVAGIRSAIRLRVDNATSSPTPFTPQALSFNPPVANPA